MKSSLFFRQIRRSYLLNGLKKAMTFKMKSTLPGLELITQNVNRRRRFKAPGGGIILQNSVKILYCEQILHYEYQKIEFEREKLNKISPEPTRERC